MSPKNILITGAGGYVGGSILADLAAQKEEPFSSAKLFASVRSPKQVEQLAKIGVHPILLNMLDEAAVENAVLENEIDIAVQNANSYQPELVTNLVRALGKRRKETGKNVYFIQSSVTTVFTEIAGFQFRGVKDADDLYGLQKKAPAHDIRDVNVLITDEAKEHGVMSYNVPLPNIYGRGFGEGRKVSVSNPAQIRTAIKERVVHKMPVEGHRAQTHISDLTILFRLLLQKILLSQSLPSNPHGYYFAFAHITSEYQVISRIAKALYARGLVDSAEPQMWSDYGIAAEKLGWPKAHIRAMTTSQDDFVAVNALELGWKPKWTSEMYLESIDEEVQMVLELDDGEASIFKAMTEKE